MSSLIPVVKGMKLSPDKAGSSLPVPLGSKPLAEGACGMKSGSRLHKGLPVITEEEYRTLYNSHSTETEARIFDFRGYVERNDGSLTFADVVALNGLRGGVHVGIDGTVSYSQGNYGLDGPEKLGEYVVYVTVPAATQKAEGVLCINDSCHSVSDYTARESRYMSISDIEEDIARQQGKEGWIVARLDIDPQQPGARDALRVLGLAITEYLRRGGPLGGLKDFIYAAESHIMSNTSMPQDSTLLPESPELAWQRFVERFSRGGF